MFIPKNMNYEGEKGRVGCDSGVDEVHRWFTHQVHQLHALPPRAGSVFTHIDSKTKHFSLNIKTFSRKSPDALSSLHSTSHPSFSTHTHKAVERGIWELIKTNSAKTIKYWGRGAWRWGWSKMRGRGNEWEKEYVCVCRYVLGCLFRLQFAGKMEGWRGRLVYIWLSVHKAPVRLAQLTWTPFNNIPDKVVFYKTTPVPIWFPWRFISIHEGDCTNHSAPALLTLLQGDRETKSRQAVLSILSSCTSVDHPLHTPSPPFGSWADVI